MMNNIEIKTSRLTLVPLGTEYLESTHAYAADPENIRFMMFLPTESLQETLARLEHFEEEWQSESPSAWEFAILRDGRHIGEIGVELTDESGQGELSWVVHPDFHCRGYATESAQAVMDFARKQLNIPHFLAHCDAENLPSQRVMRKLGMTLTGEGTRKNRDSDELRRELEFRL